MAEVKKVILTGEKVIPDEMIPERRSEIITTGGKDYLQTTEAMFTFYLRSKGELSEYFIPLMEEKKLMGTQCPSCRTVRCPICSLFCPDCNFTEVELVEMADTGVMLATPPITYFAHALFQHLAPFGRGNVLVDGISTPRSVIGLDIQLFSTKGVIGPDTFQKDMAVKIIFRKHREGRPTDIFAVPLHELPEPLRLKRRVEEDELDWESPEEPELPEATPRSRERLKLLREELALFFGRVNSSERCQENLKDWERSFLVKCFQGPEGCFMLAIKNQRITISDEITRYDFVMTCQDLDIFSNWMYQGSALTNEIIKKRLWLSKNPEFMTVTKLDRLPRSLKRSEGATL